MRDHWPLALAWLALALAVLIVIPHHAKADECLKVREFSPHTLRFTNRCDQDLHVTVCTSFAERQVLVPQGEQGRVALPQTLSHYTYKAGPQPLSCGLEPTPSADHWRRVGLACQTPTAWRVEYQVGRKSPIKPWPFECTHALKNVFVEWARREGWWDRKDRGPAPDPEYLFPEG